VDWTRLRRSSCGGQPFAGGLPRLLARVAARARLAEAGEENEYIIGQSTWTRSVQ
jgi:hypothetical protein